MRIAALYMYKIASSGRLSSKLTVSADSNNVDYRARHPLLVRMLDIFLKRPRSSSGFVIGINESGSKTSSVLLTLLGADRELRAGRSL